MRYRPLVQVVALIVVAVFTLGIWSTGGEVELQWLRFYSIAVLVAVAALNLWEVWFWRLPIFQRSEKVARDIRGTWQGALTPITTNPQTEDASEAKTVYLVVRQTASTASVVLYTDEARSKSTMVQITNEDGLVTLDYLYLGRPDSRVEDRSRMHHGAALFDVNGRPATRIRGRYWTDRDTRGELEFGMHKRAYSDDYQSAAALFT